MVRNDGTIPFSIAGRMLATNDQPEPEGHAPLVELAQLTDVSLEHALREQQDAVASAEQGFAAAREHLDAQRRRLRALQAELQRRQGIPAGSGSSTTQAPGAKRRSTTGMDALYGRDNVDPNAELKSFHFLSLQREEVILRESGDAGEQAIHFVHKDSGDLLSAHTFGEARALLELGHALGQPGLPLQRQVVWYAARGRAGRLRLDQVFVEQRGEST